MICKTNTSVSTTCYDFIVVGSGPGGAEAARILSANGKFKVLLLEAGENRNNDIPIKDSSLASINESQFYPQYYYQQAIQFGTTKTEGENQYTNGRIEGGGSSINGEQLVWPSPAVINEWYKGSGYDPDWAPSAVDATFKTIFTPIQDLPYQSTNTGYLSVNAAPAPENISQTNKDFVSAVASANLGVQEIDDYNNPSTPFGSFRRWQLTQQKQAPHNRASAATDVLSSDVRSRTNLTIINRSTVLFIKFSGTNATGVVYLENGIEKVVNASKAVLLAAGIWDPIILQRSGVGDANEIGPILASGGKSVVANVPGVGKHLTNEGVVSAVFSTPGYPISPEKTALYAGGAFLPDPSTQDTTKPRFTQLIGIDVAPGTFAIACILLDVKSEGYAKIQSPDPMYPVLATSAALADPGDRARFRSIFTEQITAIATELHNINPAYNLLQPTPEVLADPDLLDEYIATNYSHAHHWSGQCKMDSLANNGVVASDGSVYNTTNLYVVDACDLTTKADGNTQSDAYVFGHIMATKILKKYC